MRDENFRLWADTLGLRNRTTRKRYMDMVVRWTKRVGTDPVAWVKLHETDPAAFEAVAQEMVNEMVRRQQSVATIETCLYALRAWLNWNRIELKRRLIIGRTPRRPVASKQRIPSRSELRRVLDVAGPQARCIMALRCFAGLRPGILSNEFGDDGLLLSDLGGLEIRDGEPVVEQDHVVIRVRAELSKNNKPFLTFLGREGIDYLLAYLRNRVAKGEVLGPDSSVIKPQARNPRKFVSRNCITETTRKIMDTAGVKGSTYIWRAYFKAQLLPAQGKRGLVPEYVEFWMGHFNGIQSTYSFDMVLPPEVQRDMVEQYRTIAVKYLETRHGGDEGREALHVATALLQSVGVTEKDLSGVDLENPDHDALQVLVQERLQGKVAGYVAQQVSVGSAGAGARPERRQALVGLEEVGEYLEKGWYWHTEVRVPEGKALVEGPANTV